MKKIKIIVSGGGTGGHIFPAIAIAKAIEKQIKNVEFLFVGAKDRMEMEKIPNAGYNIIGLWINGFQRGLYLKNLSFPFKVIHSILKANRIIKDFNPDLVIGTGGYASGPLIYAGAKKGIPSIIQEQNSYAGVTNKILGKLVQKICVAYDKMERYFPKEKIIFTGNPIREKVLFFENNKKEAEKLFKIDSKKPTILVIGGSLGARTINDTIANNIYRFKSMGINLIWQTGISYQKIAQNIISDLNLNCITTCAFIKQMDKAYAVADIIVSRSGAIAISELCCVGKPVILVPSPNVAENHQYKNAQSLVNKNAAILVKDSKANRKLVNTLEKLIKNKRLQDILSSNIKKIGVKDAADRIAKIALNLIK